MKFRLLVIWTTSLCLCCNFTATAQTTPSIPPGTIEPTRPTPPLPDTLPRLPPKPSIEPNQPIPAQPLLPVETTVEVKRVQVLGSTVFSQEELSKVVAPFENKSFTWEQLLEIRTAITDFYTSQGYTTSGAFLPPQEVTDGVVQVQVIEGELERVEVRGLERLKSSYVRSRIEAAAKTPIKISRLQEALQLLQLDPLIKKVEANLTTGTATGRYVLLLDLEEASPFQGYLITDNRENPSVGETGGTVALSHTNLLGLGDRLNASVELTEGVLGYGVNYSVPLNARNGTLSFRYDNGRNTVVEDRFAEIGIRGRTETYSLSFRQPIILTPNTEFALSLSGDLRSSKTFLDDQLYSFTLGPENGKSNISAVRFTQDWVNRSSNRVLAARSQFSLGIDAFDATTNNTGIDGRFFSWLGQFQWVQALNKQRDFTVIVNIASQLTSDSLLPIEQFSIGGLDSVRGYRTNQRVGDNGVVGSLEVRVPVIRDFDGFGLLQIAPFFDIGTIWSNGDTGTDSSTLASIGLGLRWQLNDSLNARLDWGVPLISVDRQGDSLQDNGINFSVQWNPF